MPSLHTLVKVAAIGGIATCSLGMATFYKYNLRVKETEYYKECITAVRQHKGAVQFMGEPIKCGNINVGDHTINFTKTLEAQYQVPVKGPLQRGTVYFWASRATETDPWRVHRIEVGLQNEHDRRLIIRKE